MIANSIELTRVVRGALGAGLSYEIGANGLNKNMNFVLFDICSCMAHTKKLSSFVLARGCGVVG